MSKTEQPSFESKPFNIETVRSPEDNEVSFSPERGGIITSLTLGGKELLYMDWDTFRSEDPGTSVKGGIPILFPQAGPLKPDVLAKLSLDDPLRNLKQHGFARNSAAWRAQTGERAFRETLSSDNETRKAFPYDFELSMVGELEKDGSFTLIQGAVNKERGKVMPLAMGLHPYFRVPHDKKHLIKFDFPGGENISPEPPPEDPNRAEKFDNPRLHGHEPMRIVIPELGTLVMDVSREYKRIWVWSIPGKDFVCIEPVMRDAGGLVNDPEQVPPGKSVVGRVNFRLEK